MNRTDLLHYNNNHHHHRQQERHVSLIVQYLLLSFDALVHVSRANGMSRESVCAGGFPGWNIDVITIHCAPSSSEIFFIPAVSSVSIVGAYKPGILWGRVVRSGSCSTGQWSDCQRFADSISVACWTVTRPGHAHLKTHTIIS